MSGARMTEPYVPERGSLGRHIKRTALRVADWPEWLKPAYVKAGEALGEAERESGQS